MIWATAVISWKASIDTNKVKYLEILMFIKCFKTLDFIGLHDNPDCPHLPGEERVSKRLGHSPPPPCPALEDSLVVSCRTKHTVTM